MRYITFIRKSKDLKEQAQLLTMKVSEIKEIVSQQGSQNTYLKVNGIEVKGSYDALLSLLSCYNQSQEEEIIYNYGFSAPFQIHRFCE